MSTAEQIAAQLRAALTAETRRQLLVEAGTIAQREVQAAAPVRSGYLRSSVGLTVEGDIRARIVADAPYARMVNEGTRPHVIVPVRRRALAWPGGAHPVRIVHHPGSHGRHFLEQGLDRAQPKVERVGAAWGLKVLATVK